MLIHLLILLCLYFFMLSPNKCLCRPMLRKEFTFPWPNCCCKIMVKLKQHALMGTSVPHVVVATNGKFQAAHKHADIIALLYVKLFAPSQLCELNDCSSDLSRTTPFTYSLFYNSCTNMILNGR